MSSKKREKIYFLILFIIVLSIGIALDIEGKKQNNKSMKDWATVLNTFGSIGIGLLIIMFLYKKYKK